MGSAEGRSAEAKSSESNSSAERISLLLGGGAWVSLRPGRLPIETLAIDLPELPGDVSLITKRGVADEVAVAAG